MRRRLLGTILACMLAPRAARADEVGVWAGEVLTVDLRRPSQPVGPLLWLELTQRKWGASWRSMVRPAVGVSGRVGRTELSGWLGYAMDANHQDGGDWAFEHRLWQMFQAETKLTATNPTRLTERLRLEQRWLPGSDDVQVRLRIFARGLMPIAEGGWGVSVWDEAFFKLNAVDVANAGFDQNRFFVGPYFQSDKGIRTEIGYLNLLASRRDAISGEDVLVDSHLALAMLTVALKAFQRDRPKTDTTAATVPEPFVPEPG